MAFFASPRCQAAASAAAKGGDITEQEVLGAFDRLDRYRQKLEGDGQLTGNAARIKKFAEDEAQRTAIAAATRKRQAALAVLAKQGNRETIAAWRSAGMPAPRVLEALWLGAGGKYSNVAGGRKSVWASKAANRWLYVGGLLSEIQAEKPHLFNMAFDRQFDRDVFTEMTELRKDGKTGKTGNADAQWLAKSFMKWAELSRTDANRLGATIAKMDGWNGVQTHDEIKMIKAGKGSIEAKDSWVGYIATKLDMERTFPDGLSPEEAARALGDIYDTIITGTPNTTDPATLTGRVNPANLANSLGKHRVLHFQDAEAALAYRDKFGFSTTIGGMLNHLTRMADVNGIMGTMGPNPEAMFAQLVGEQKEHVRTDPTLSPKIKNKWSKQLTMQGGVLRSAFNIGTGVHSRVAGDGTFASITSGIRTVQRLGKLGGATLTSVPSDTVTSALAAQFRGNSFLSSLMKQIAGIMRGRPRGEQAEVAYLTSAAWEGWMNRVMQNAAAADTPRGLLGKAEELFFRANGLTQTTDISRSVAGRAMAAEMGMRASKAYGDLPPKYRHVLGLNGIDETRWDAIRQASLRNVDGKPYVTPDRIAELPDEAIMPLVQDRLVGANGDPAREAAIIEGARRDLQLDVLRFYADEASFAVVTPDDATTKYTTWGGLQRGTMGGEAARMVMQFKATPIAFLQRPVARLLYGSRKGAGALERLPHFGAFATGLLLAGYMSMTMKDMVKGYWPPRDPKDPRTIGAAALQSGAIGILGDFLFANASRFGGGTLETAAGPTLGSIGSLLDAGLDAKDALLSGGEDKFSGASAFNSVYGWTPFANIWWLAPAMNYLWVNSLREALSPGYLRRTARNRQRQYGQTSQSPIGLGPTLAGDLRQ